MERSKMNKLKLIRYERGLSVREFADLLGVNYSTYYRAEANLQSLTMKNLRKIADGLGMTILDLLEE